MDNKITKERLNNHLEYDWFKYVLILIVSIALFIFVFQQINADREYEKIALFATTYEYKGGDFVTDVKKDINADIEEAGSKAAKLRSLTIEPVSPQSNEYATLLQTHGDVTSDLLIVGESYMKTTYQYSMLDWDDHVVRACIPTHLADPLEYWEVKLDGKTYRRGLRIDNLKNIDALFDFDPEIPEDSILHKDYDSLTENEQQQYDVEKRKYDDKFYLVINPSSVNIGVKNRKGKADPNNEQAFMLVRKLLAKYGAAVTA